MQNERWMRSLGAVLLTLCVVGVSQRGPASGQEHPGMVDPGLADPGMAASGMGDTGSGALLVRDPSGVQFEAPILDTDVYVWVTGIIARTQVTQRFYNPSSEWVAGTYVFPLPETAAVDHLTMHVGSRRIEGQVRERGEARKVYEEARKTGRKASLVEQQRPNVFTTEVANIGPGERIEVVIEYQEIVRYDSGDFRLRLPLVVAPRYESGLGGEGAAAPESRETAALGNGSQCAQDDRAAYPINPVVLTIELDAGFPLRSLYSPSHLIEVSEVDDSKLVRLQEIQTPADRDFVLIWTPERGAEPQTAVFTELLDDETFALLMILPPEAQNRPGERLPREAVFVVDTSGSMGGPSLEQAKLALLLALDSLRQGDRFNIVEFNSAAKELFPSSVAVSSQTTEVARQFVDSLQASGGTHIRSALELALDGDRQAGSIRQVVFITDGAVGNEAELFRFIEDRLRDSRLFTVGIGSAPNSYFMRKAAHFGRGTFTYIASPAEVSERMDGLFRKLEAPTLADIELAWDDPEAESFPQRVPDLYAGEPLVVAVRLSNAADSVEVVGSRGTQDWEALLSLDESGDCADSDDPNWLRPAATLGIGRLWARRKIESVMDGLTLGADPEEVRSTVARLGIQHHLVTRYTSLVAVDVTPTAPLGDPQARRVPLNHPFGTVGVLPQTATPAALHAWIAAILSLTAVVLRPRRRAAVPSCG